MSDYISREEVLKALDWKWAGKAAIDAVKDLPADDVVEQRTGKWETEICDDGYGAYNLYKCDQCGDLSAQPRNYCMECGAKMIKDEP